MTDVRFPGNRYYGNILDVVTVQAYREQRKITDFLAFSVVLTQDSAAGTIPTISQECLWPMLFSARL